MLILILFFYSLKRRINNTNSAVINAQICAFISTRFFLIMDLASYSMSMWEQWFLIQDHKLLVSGFAFLTFYSSVSKR